MTPAQKFAAWLGPAMRKAGLDIDKQQGGGRVALATACGVSRSTVGRWLDGQSMPSPEHFEAIADALGVPVIDLLTGAGIVSAESLNIPRPATFPTPEEAAVAWGINPKDRDLLLNFVDQLVKRANKDS